MVVNQTVHTKGKKKWINVEKWTEFSGVLFLLIFNLNGLEGELESSNLSISNSLPEWWFFLLSHLLLGFCCDLIDHSGIGNIKSTSKLLVQIHPIFGSRDKLTGIGLAKKIQNIEQISSATPTKIINERQWKIQQYIPAKVYSRKSVRCLNIQVQVQNFHRVQKWHRAILNLYFTG